MKHRYIIFFIVLIAILSAPFSGVGVKREKDVSAAQENAVIVDYADFLRFAKKGENVGYYERSDNVEKKEYYDGSDNVEKKEYYEGSDNVENGGYYEGSDNGELSDYFGKNAESRHPDVHERAKVELLYNGKAFRYVDEIIVPTDHLVAEQIFSRKLNAPLSDKLRLAEKCLDAGASYKSAMLYVFPLLEKKVDKLKKFVDCAPVESRIDFSPEERPMFTISREKNGYELLEAKLYQDVYYSLKRTNEVRLNVIPKILYPAVTAYDNMRSTNLRAKFSTDYSHSVDERKHNIKLAMSKINGKALMPGEEFSFNKTVGRRSEKNGFLTAKIIVKGEYVDGVGGGVCQASTTVYNCAIRADMEITQVRNHSLTSSYVPVSFDAMVNSGSSDLKFKNNSKYPVFIRAFGTESYAQVEIYGTALPYRIATESVVISKSDPPPDREFLDTQYKYVTQEMAPGSKMRVQYSHGALESEGYLLYYSLSGSLIEKKLIRKDKYNSCEGLIAIVPAPAQN